MGLPETFKSIRPSVVAFIDRVVKTKQGEKPVFPFILGTGFFVDSSGIVATNRHLIEGIEEISQGPRHPKTGANPAGALVFTEVRTGENEVRMGMLNVDVVGWDALESFSVDSPWFGEDVPDLGFVQLKVRGAPTLALATEPNTLRAGLAVATAGFPEGDATVTFYKKITQLTPVLRHGIVSSVFPFDAPHPHGFSIDTLLQGGASGSPVFLTDRPVVVGMIASHIKDTNYTVSVPSRILALALQDVIKAWPNVPEYPTLNDLIKSGEADGRTALTWDEYPV